MSLKWLLAVYLRYVLGIGSLQFKAVGDLSAVPGGFNLADTLSEDVRVKRNDDLHQLRLSSLLSNLESYGDDGDSNSSPGPFNGFLVNPKKTKSKTTSWFQHPAEGTTKHIKELFIGRCFEYQLKRANHNDEEINCYKIWSLFHRAFAYKGPCDVTAKQYLPFLIAVEEDIPKDKGLLWSGTRELAHKYSDFKYSKRFITLEDTLAGYLLTGLTWCGSKLPPGMDFHTCPWECGIQSPFWAAANLKFAEKLKGVVHLLLNGTRQHLSDKRIWPSYMKYRYYLGPYVIPHLNPRFITEVRIIVAHTLHIKQLEHCGAATVKQLQNDIIKKGIRVTCYDDPHAIKHILCVDDPMSLECKKFL